uniref:Heat shock protein A4 n=1 Tax=Stichopus japonicus TaxID=307972 RepID=A0A455ZC23_STIJA|nr:TPA_exp: heat shock protein A4 [Apostichopus japonicus]
MAVVGFDVGNLSSYIAVAKGGGIETIANEHSDRMTPSVVSFSGPQRSQGQEAKSQMVTNPKNTVSQFKRFIGRKYKDPAVQEELKRTPYNVVETENGGIGMQVQYQNEQEVFSPEQVTATFLTKLKTTTETALNTKVIDCVISVPQYFTDTERRAVCNSAYIAGLNCLRVMNDTTAVALAYGIYKQDLPTPEEKPRNVVFVDMGHSSLQVAICAFNKGKLKVLSTASDRSLGGRDFDRVIFEQLAKDFLDKYKIDVNSKLRARQRVLVEAEKLKKQMSANATRIPVNMESVMDDKDVRSGMQRSEFEALAADLLKRVEVPLKAALDQIKIKLEDIFSVEIIGGSTRIPAVKEIIKSVFKKELSTTLNQDEAVSRGCALQCAILSPTFRVREFTVTDLTPYPIKLKWTSAKGEPGEMVVFKKNDEVPFTRMLTFYRSEAFSLEAFYSDEVPVPYPDSFIGKFTVKNITPNEEGESPKIKVKVNINRHGIFSVSSAHVVVKLPPEPEPEEPKEEAGKEGKGVNGKEEVNKEGGGGEEGAKMETEPTTPNDTAGTEEQPKQGAAGQEGEEKMETSEEQQEKQDETDTSKTKDEEEGKKENGDKEDGKKGKAKVKYSNRDLPIESVVNELTLPQLQLLYEKEMHMVAQDKLERDRSHAKNNVEEYVYEMREKMYGSLEIYITEEDREKFSALLNETEDWLYGDGEDLQKNAYITKLEDLKKLGDPVVKREQEATERPRAFDELGQALILYRKFLTQYNDGDEKFSHIEKADIEKVERCLKEKEEWRDKKQNAQNQIPLTKDPVVLASQVRTELQNLISTCDPITKKPKPKPKEEPPKEEPPKDETPKPEGDNPTPTDEKMETESTEANKEETNPPPQADEMEVD